MNSLTLEEQFVRELQELLRIERRLSPQIASAAHLLDELPSGSLGSCLLRKHHQIEALEEILKSMNRDIAGYASLDSEFSAEVEPIISIEWTDRDSAVAAMQEAAELLSHQYKQLATHARILALTDAEDLLHSAHVGEAQLSVAMTNFEFHVVRRRCEKAATA